jgi:hypothetical protein
VTGSPIRARASSRALPSAPELFFHRGREVSMRRTVMVVLTATLLAAAWPARDAAAGVVIVTESEPPAGTKAAQAGKSSGDTRYSGRLYVDGDHVRMEGASRQGDEISSGTILYRPDPEALLVLNPERKSYFEMTRADAKRIGGAIDAARAQMLAQMQKLTPEQRAAFQQALDGFGAGDLAKGKAKTPPEPAKAVATGSSDTIDGHPCRGYDVMRGARKLAEACVASWQELGLAPGDVDGLRKLAAFQEQMFSDVNLGNRDAAPGSEAFEVMDQIKGLPLRVRSFVDPKRPVVMRVVRVDRKDIDPKLFQVPAGYTRRTPPGR